MPAYTRGQATGSLANVLFQPVHLLAAMHEPPRPTPQQIELHRDLTWRRNEDLSVERAVDAERFIEDVGFVNKR